jgi:prophage antirepressor-like protein
MENLQIFNYGEIPVRTVLIDGEPWWVLADVCRVLNIERADSAARRLDPDEKGTHLVSTPGGTQNMTVINESGLYRVILRSDKPEAKAFTRWVTHEVLPAIRKTGAYSMTTPPPTGQRALTVDDYLTAARMVSSCRNERFPYLLSLLKDAGFNIPDVERPIPAPTPDKFDYNRLTNSEFADMLAHLLAEKGMTQADLCKATNIGAPSISQYLKGIHKPAFGRYTIIIEALT